MYDGDQITPEACWVHFTTRPDCKSYGVMAVSVEECSAEQLPARPDPEPFPEHAVVDFTGFTDNQVEKKGKKLKAKAEARGWLHVIPGH